VITRRVISLEDKPREYLETMARLPERISRHFGIRNPQAIHNRVLRFLAVIVIFYIRAYIKCRNYVSNSFTWTTEQLSGLWREHSDTANHVGHGLCAAYDEHGVRLDLISLFQHANTAFWRDDGTSTCQICPNHGNGGMRRRRIPKEDDLKPLTKASEPTDAGDIVS